MPYKIDNIEFEGMNGTLQKPKPTFETYTRLGDNTVYIQKLNVSSLQSSISMWQAFNNLVNLDAHIQKLKSIAGKRVKIEQEGVIISSCFVIDYSYKIKKVAGLNPYILTIDCTIITDEREK